MWRTLPVCALMLFFTSFGWGDDKPVDPNTIVIRLKVKPMAAPKPALKYQLLPELREMNPGNPIHEYTRCFAEQTNFWNTKQQLEKREQWQSMPLKDLPLKEIRDFGRGPLDRADYAARMDAPNWQMLLKLKSDGIRTLLPDIQQLRNLGGALKVRFRFEVAEGRFEDALVTAKTMFALSRHLGEHPTMICDLVGIAIASLAIGPIDEMIQQPGCPNLFWALTDLPHPFIDIRKGLQGERVWTETEFAGLTDREPMSDRELQRIVQRLLKDFQSNMKPTKGPQRDLNDELKKRLANEDYLHAARKRLAVYGLTEEKTKEFPPLQIILLDEKMQLEAQRDERAKAMALPYWQAEPMLRAAHQSKKPRPDPLLPDLFVSYDKVKLAQTRLDQRLALLRCVEALRLYAAGHDGKLPSKLEDIDLPLPVAPATGKPFSYKVEGETAHLECARLIIQVRYEVTFIK